MTEIKRANEEVHISGFVEEMYNGSYIMNDKIELDIGPFDFPLTDNFTINSSYRFAFMQYTDLEIDDMEGIKKLKFIWFPENYVTERERPLGPLLTEETGLMDSFKKLFE